MIKHCLFCIIFSSLAVINLRAQHTDAAVWLYSGIKVEPVKDINLEVGEELRYNFSVASLYQVNTHASLSYSFTKKIKVNGEYRYSVRDNGNTNRVGIGLSYREGFGKLDLGFRTKYQYSTAPDGAEGTTFRNKGTIFYEYSKEMTFYVSGEVFYNFLPEGNAFQDMRYEGGVDYAPNKHHDLTVSYIYDREFAVISPERLHVANVSYAYKF